MNIIVFDTETISVDKPFCYNIGYVVYDSDRDEVILKRDFVVEQIWHNDALFATAYYAKKRPLYVASMRARKTIMDKYGYIQAQMERDIRQNNVVGVYAFNSPFDDRVFGFNSEYYHCRNALDTVPVFDIRGYAIAYLADSNYFDFLNKNENVKGADGNKKFITDSDGYKTTAESFYCYLTGQVDFDEAHTALADSEIELDILKECLKQGAQLQCNYEVPRSLPRNSKKMLTIKNADGQVMGMYEYVNKVERKVKSGLNITLK